MWIRSLTLSVFSRAAEAAKETVGRRVKATFTLASLTLSGIQTGKTADTTSERLARRSLYHTWTCETICNFLRFDSTGFLGRQQTLVYVV